VSHSADIKAAAVNLAAWFPVEHDANGRVTAYAAEATIDATGETAFFIIRPGHDDSPSGNGCDCPECAPHEQDGPVPFAWLYAHTAPHCTALNCDGSKCGNVTDHPSGMCGTHRKRAAR